jgi:hypothetical protein
MLAEILAVIVVTLAVLGPASYLLRMAWRRGRAARAIAIAVLVTMFGLVAWLFWPRPPGASAQEHIADFVGAWGILFAAVGLVVIAAAASGRLKPRRDASDDKP